MVDNVRLMYKAVFWAVRKLLEDNFVLIETREQNEGQISMLNQNITDMRENIIKLNHEHQGNLSRLR